MFSSNTSQVSNAATYIEDVFSTYLYTGNGSTQTITNGIDLAGKGGLVWVKARNAAYGLLNWDTSMPYFSNLSTYNTDALINQGSPFGIASTSATGFATGNTNWARVNESGTTYASWTFRKQPKFFDVVTWTGDGTNNRAISHSIGGTVGCLIVKKTSGIGDWPVWHRSLPAYGANPQSKSTLYLNATLGGDADVYFGSTAPTATAFYVDVAANASGATYVAYLFAHDAGGFGLTGTDNVISCGSFTTDGSGNATVSLGYEPQWVLIKKSSGTGDWILLDTMRGWVNSGAPGISADARLYPNTSGAESLDDWGHPTATGMYIYGQAISQTYIYIAIRRGPMRTPTSGTSVFSPNAYTGNGTSQTITAGFPIDLSMFRGRGLKPTLVADRLRGAPQRLFTSSTDAETTNATSVTSLASNTGVTVGANGNTNATTETYVNWSFGRAPGFFDEVCWTGDDVAPRNINHNLTVAPEMMIVKNRTMAGTYWIVYHKDLPSALYFLSVNTTNAQSTGTNVWRSTAPTSTVFTVGNDSWVNSSGNSYVNYLFASCPGVSKVGSYTGTGTTQQINCGFTAGARFVLIKRTDSTGDWYVWDTARGIVSGNDPYLLLNSTAAEVTSTDYIDTYSAGFEISSTAPAAINASGGTFIYLAIA